jgi:hypothetical protein
VLKKQLMKIPDAYANEVRRNLQTNQKSRWHGLGSCGYAKSHYCHTVSILVLFYFHTCAPGAWAPTTKWQRSRPRPDPFCDLGPGPGPKHLKIIPNEYETHEKLMRFGILSTISSCSFHLVLLVHSYDFSYLRRPPYFSSRVSRAGSNGKLSCHFLHVGKSEGVRCQRKLPPRIPGWSGNG